MCGIVGFINLDSAPASKEIISSITDTLKHRGPDERGIEIHGNVAFGHRRLSIIDLHTGQQPMRSACGRFMISFNGEIFNYLELKNELKSEGLSFRTTSDTEVLLEGFIRHGIDFFSKLNGQFAFGIYDFNSSKLILVRDRLGEKPLYFAQFQRSFIFASELNPILRYAKLLGLETNLSHQSIIHFLSLNYIPFNQTFVDEIKSVPAASYIEISGANLAGRLYWNPPLQEVECDKSSAVTKLGGLLNESVKLRLRSDVPVGLFLSSGIDSTLVASAVASHTSDVKAFIASFKETGFCEGDEAIATCNKIGIPYELVEIDPIKENITDLIEELVSHGDEPLADSSSLPVYLLSRETSRDVKVVLSGDGGDELFGGYLTYRATALALRMPYLVRHLLHLFTPLIRSIPAQNVKVGWHEKLERFLRNLSLSPAEAHFAWNGMFNAEEKRKLLCSNVFNSGERLNTYETLVEEYHLNSNKPTLQSLLIADQVTYLGHDILKKVDRMSMAHGLEVRPALLDHRIVEFAREMPPQFIINGRDTKVLLRALLRKECPWYQTRREKLGFSIPVHLWFRTILKEYFEDLLSSEFAKSFPIYNHKYVMFLWKQHLSCKRNLGFELWGIMVSLLWAKKVLRG